jgi:hypothetical protein
MIKGVSFVRQLPGFRSERAQRRQGGDLSGGEACAEMALRKLGRAVTQAQFFAIARVNPTRGRGANVEELDRGLKRLGFETGKVWYRVRQTRKLEAQLRTLRADLEAGIPSVVLLDGARFVLVVGFDERSDEVVYHDPALSDGAHRRLKRAAFVDRWKHRHRRRGRVVTRIPLRAETITIPALKHPRGHSPADYAQHIRALRPRLRKLKGRFTIDIQRPFVVVGDGRNVRGYTRGFIKKVVTLLKKDFFNKDPRILDIYLFRDRKSYLENARRLTGTTPDTPYGFFSTSLDALVMNIKPGAGTLSHEIVHPFIEANFPSCPPWFNEGLGSLYEAVWWRRGKIWGFVNWRLPGLQQAIRAGAVPTFKRLMAQNEHQFYMQDPGTNYAQSRYLLYYLQDKGLLRTYYHRFLKNRRTDPTGHETLKTLLKVDDIDAFQRRWEAYVLKLRWRR